MLRKIKAFTLVELLVVTAVLGFISLGIYSTFSNGIRIWDKIGRASPKQDLYIFFDRFSADLRNSIKFRTISFSGSEDNIGFAALVDSANLGKKTVGKISYFYDSKKCSIYREEKDFSCVYEGSSGIAKEVLKNISGLKLQYYSYDTQRQQYVWQDIWAKEDVPLAVWMEIEITDGGNVFNYSRTINIPAAG